MALIISHDILLQSTILTLKKIRQQAEIHESNFYQGRASEEWLDALKPLGTYAKKPYLEHAPKP
jgi:hypothetical protein